jgi:RND superfamily putative drug exporter
VLALEALIERRLSGSVRGWVVGQAPLSRALNDQLVESAEKAELLSFPVLLIVLLLVFRSVVAALVPLTIAGGTVLAGTGLLELITRLTPLDAIALSLASMMGLALGVDYSLLIVSRCREELARGLSGRSAASLAANTAGRTAAFAGVVLIAIMSMALLLSPGSVLLSAAVGTLVVTVLGMLGALLVTPAVLALLGPRVEMGRIGRSRARRDRIGPVVGAATRRPVVASVAVACVLLALTLPVLGLGTVPPDPASLPAGHHAGQGLRNARAIGLGPNLEVTLRAGAGAITRPDRLAAIRALEGRLRRLEFTRIVAGPGALAGEQVGQTPDVGEGRTRLAELTDGLGRASSGVSRLRRGLRSAGEGAGRLREGAEELVAGSGRAAGGAAALARGAREADAGVDRLVAGLVRARGAARQLAEGAERARRGARAVADGAGQLSGGLDGRLVPSLRTLADGLESGGKGLGDLRGAAQRAESELRAAHEGLLKMSAGKLDPQYARSLTAVATALAAVTGKDPRDGSLVQDGYGGLDADLGRAADEARTAASGARSLAAGAERAIAGARRLRDGARALDRGLGALESGAEQLRGGVARLDDGARDGQAEFARLVDGSGELAEGLRKLRGGSGLGALAAAQGELERGLVRAVDRTGPLDRGLGGAAGQVAGLNGKLDLRALERLQKTSPDFFLSGYAALAAVDGARPLPRAAASFLMATDKGGDAGRILVTPDLEPNDPRAPQFVAAVRHELAALPPSLGLRTGIGGPTAVLAEYDEVTQSRLPWLVFGIALVTYLLLIPILRSLVLPAIAVALNLLTVGAAFGLLTLLFTGSNPVLGGPGALDVISVASIFAIVFALSIDYQVFLLVRMREAYVATQRNDRAISFGVEHTARVVTGAAVIMIGVFCAFAVTGFASLRQFGVGLAFAVALDATIVRLVLLPALMQWFGLRAWWLPRWLDDRLPSLDVEGSDTVADTTAITRRAAAAW